MFKSSHPLTGQQVQITISVPPTGVARMKGFLHSEDRVHYFFSDDGKTVSFSLLKANVVIVETVQNATAFNKANVASSDEDDFMTDKDLKPKFVH